jgi:hypothetical protein
MIRSRTIGGQDSTALTNPRTIGQSTVHAFMTRLQRSSRAESAARQEAHDIALGKKWAADHANHDQLAAVASLADTSESPWEGELSA